MPLMSATVAFWNDYQRPELYFQFLTSHCIDVVRCWNFHICRHRRLPRKIWKMDTEWSLAKIWQVVFYYAKL